MAITKIIIQPDEHVYVAGQTGTGKTQMARKYLANYENVVVLDIKGRFEWPEVPAKKQKLVTEIAELPDVEEKKIIYRPNFREMNLEYYNRFFEWIYNRENTIVLIDELMGICPNPQVYPEYYKACLTRGRELVIGVWSMTQRPTGVPVLAMSESSHIISFLLKMPQDRHKLAESTGCPEFEYPPGRKKDYMFWYYNDNMDRPVKAKIVERR